jgi:hypothetical protein
MLVIRERQVNHPTPLYAIDHGNPQKPNSSDPFFPIGSLNQDIRVRW